MSRKKEFTCNICGTPVKRTTLTQRTLDAVQCEKDTNWRRRLLKVYNKTQDDFPSLKEYNDYLEHVEGMDHHLFEKQRMVLVVLMWCLFPPFGLFLH
jgi:CDK-activating kinase assembly factor MAT1